MKEKTINIIISSHKDGLILNLKYQLPLKRLPEIVSYLEDVAEKKKKKESKSLLP